VLARLAVDGQKKAHPGEDERCLLALELLRDRRVHLPEEPQQVFAGVGPGVVAVEDGRTAAPAAARAGVELELPLGIVVAQGLGEAAGRVLQRDLLDAAARGPQEPDLVLAEREDVERPAFGQQGQEGLYVVAVGNDRELVEAQRKPVARERIPG
jgi:hypothetical protein